MNEPGHMPLPHEVVADDLGLLDVVFRDQDVRTHSQDCRCCRQDAHTILTRPSYPVDRLSAMSRHTPKVRSFLHGSRQLGDPGQEFSSANPDVARQRSARRTALIAGGASMSFVKRGVGFWVRRRCRRGALRRAR